MGFWNSLGNALGEAFAEAGSRALVGIGLAAMSDKDLLDTFDSLETYFYYYDETDENYEQNTQLKQMAEEVLKGRGYRPKTVYVKDE